MEIVTADIGGTNARFAIAEVADGRVIRLDEAVKLKAAEHASLQLAWAAFGRELGRPLPRAGAIAVACPIVGEVLKLTNNPWVIRPALIPEKLELDSHVLINDFGAIAHAVAQLGEAELEHVCGPDEPLPAEGTISIIGPGTGLGVAHVLRRDGRYFVVETEGGHTDFAPLDSLEDQILARLRKRYGRVSCERIVSGPGLVNLYEALAKIEDEPVRIGDDTALWTAALDGTDSLAAAALDRFCLAFGSVAGDVALAQGAVGLVIAGGVGARVAGVLPTSGFGRRFTAKGRFETMMAGIPVKRITHAEPGLFGAAAAFARAMG